MSRTISLILLLTLTGCGAETVGTAAIVAKQKQQEIEEGQKLKESVLQQIDAAQALEQQRLKEAEAR
jgi:hypothetical protein